MRFLGKDSSRLRGPLLTKIIEHAHSKALRAGACVLRKGSPALTAGPPYENKKPNETFISLSLTATTINCPYGSTYIFKLQVIFCFFYTISVHLGTELPVPRGGLGTEVPVPRYMSPDTKWRGLFSHGLLASVQLIISALHVNELIVGASLYDASLLHDHDAVRVLDRGKSVSYDK